MSYENESGFAAATRVIAGDDGTSYDPVAIGLHWTTAVLVVVQMTLAQTWGLFGRPARHLMITAHMSLGIILTAVIVARLVWRFIPGHQVAPADVGWLRIASKAVHYLLYVLLAAEAVLGFLLRWSGGESMSFFGLQIPPPFPEWSRPAHHLVNTLHEWNGWTIIGIAAVHALAALYHHYVLHDRVLKRMLPGGMAEPVA
jgi:cytochrome b561